MSNRTIEALGFIGLLVATLLAGTSSVIGVAGHVEAMSELDSAAKSVEAVTRLRSDGEQREFDARIGALRIVASSENPRLERALVGVEAIRKIEREAGRGAASNEAVALGLEEARRAVEGDGSVSPKTLAALLSAVAAILVMFGTLAMWRLARSNERNRRRVVDAMGLERSVAESATFADEVLLEWVLRRAAGSSQPRAEANGERGGLALVENTEKVDQAPVADASIPTVVFSPTRRR